MAQEEGDGGVKHEGIAHDSFERMRLKLKLKWWGECEVCLAGQISANGETEGQSGEKDQFVNKAIEPEKIPSPPIRMGARRRACAETVRDLRHSYGRVHWGQRRERIRTRRRLDAGRDGIVQQLTGIRREELRL